jgi:hypothetical protein
MARPAGRQALDVDDLAAIAGQIVDLAQESSGVHGGHCTTEDVLAQMF